MLKFYKKLENKLYKYSIPNLYVYIIGAAIIGYILCYVFPAVYYYLPFNPYLVIYKHQYWRCITWLFEIPFSLESDINKIFLPINLYFYYFIGKNLQYIFGKFSFNLYAFGGWFMSTIGMLFASVYMFNFSANKDMYMMAYQLLGDSTNLGFVSFMGIGATYYFFTSIFYAFALIFPDMMVRMFFVIPMKIKWSAWITGIFMTYRFLQGDLPQRVIIVMCTLNFILYYFMVRSLRGRSLKTIKRQMVYRNKVRAAQSGRSTGRTNADVRPRERNTNVYKMPAGKAIHKCAICGRSEQDGENMEFRYCSKCNGDLEYCQDHLYTHQHVTGSPVNNENTNN